MFKPLFLSAALLINSTAVLANKSSPLLRFEDTQTNKYGFKNKAGVVIIPAQYDWVFAYPEEGNTPAFFPSKKPYVAGYAAVMKDGKVYLINRRGETLLQVYFFDNGPDYFEEDFARFVEGGKMGFFNRHGNKVVAAQWDFVREFKNGYAAVNNGRVTERTGRCCEIRVIQEGEWGLIDKAGKLVIPVQKISYDNLMKKKAELLA